MDHAGGGSGSGSAADAPGQAEVDTLRARCSRSVIPRLKFVLRRINLPRSGRKQDLIERIVGYAILGRAHYHAASYHVEHGEWGRYSLKEPPARALSLGAQPRGPGSAARARPEAPGHDRRGALRGGSGPRKWGYC